jgi:hypothetical protein
MKSQTLSALASFALVLSFPAFVSCGIMKSKVNQVAASSVQEGVDYLKNMSQLKDYRLMEGAVYDPGSTPPRVVGRMAKFSIVNESVAGQQDLFIQNTTQYNFHNQFFVAAQTSLPQLKDLTDSLTYESRIYELQKPESVAAGALKFMEQVVENSDGTVSDSFVFEMYLDPKKLSTPADKDLVAAKILRAHTFLSGALPKSFPLRYLIQDAGFFVKMKSSLDKAGVPYLRILPSANKTYVAGISYGYLRSLSLEDIEKGRYSSKDILFLEDIPLDISPVAGVISSAFQPDHSHVVFRTTSLKIPNIFVREAYQKTDIVGRFNQLVQLTTRADGTYELLTSAELQNIDSLAQAFWSSRGKLGNVPAPDYSVTAFLPFQSQKVQRSDVAIYGAKGVNFANLDQHLRSAGVDRSENAGGLLIPFSFYKSHVSTTLNKTLCDAANAKCSKKESTQLCSAAYTQCQALTTSGSTLEGFLAKMVTDHQVNFVQEHDQRRAWLEYSRQLIRAVEVNPSFLKALRDHISKHYAANVRIRFRSSTNNEDLPGFNGAGLYESASACIGDDNPASGSTGSACLTKTEADRKKQLIEMLKGDPRSAEIVAGLKQDLEETKPLNKAISKVFASLWSEKAYRTRQEVGVDHLSVAMGMLMHPSFVDETANGVVLFHRETDSNGAILEKSDIVAQINDISVTNPEIPDARPERTLLQKSASGSTVKKLVVSSLSPAAPVLSAIQLDSLHSQISSVYDSFLALYGSSFSEQLDVEFKVDANGNVKIKQARPL